MDIKQLHGGINSNSDKIKRGQRADKHSVNDITGLEHRLEKRERRDSKDIHGLRTKTVGLEKDMNRIEKYSKDLSKRV